MPVSYEKEWKQALKECQKHRVFLLFSKEEYPLRQFAEQQPQNDSPARLLTWAQ